MYKKLLTNKSLHVANGGTTHKTCMSIDWCPDWKQFFSAMMVDRVYFWSLVNAIIFHQRILLLGPPVCTQLRYGNDTEDNEATEPDGTLEDCKRDWFPYICQRLLAKCSWMQGSFDLLDLRITLKTLEQIVNSIAKGKKHQYTERSVETVLPEFKLEDNTNKLILTNELSKNN
ncbi:hypothetical protein FF38_03629 [Lucilia cuprina]|uniref:Uncharacterized protein n=1 Tax=Lucilia cuprina TaxID=7375 RepID=A0A0L0CNW6_LUCCU|nr:hypothetical protein FF38_03629 [Lucilia cuprina]